MEMERSKGVECCWCGSTPAAGGGIAQIFGFALRACISEGVLYMNCVWVPFSAQSFDTLSLASKVAYSTVREQKCFHGTQSKHWL